ncbi:MAG: UvrY/SirA/GacA family response regulator transcription factor [Ruminobacter sp.]|nr:UvrY/SirA/GacA family response regulator transcription factor [Ruminobacter sp.]
MIKIFLVDDHDIVRAGIKRILEDLKGVTVAGEASTGEDAVVWCRQHQCDIVLMDMNLPGIDGIEATKRVLRANPDARVIMLTVQSNDPIPSQVMKAGAYGFVTKGAAPEVMIKAIEEVYAGNRYLEPEIAQMMALERFSASSKKEVGEDGNPFKLLADRELQISTMISQGLKVNEIADRLAISPKTVNSYRYRVFKKLNINGDVELTRLALRYGYGGIAGN